MTRQERVLTMAHGHPDFSFGGAEIAAHELFEAYTQHPSVEASWLLACGTPPHVMSGRMMRLKENQYLWGQSTPDTFTMTAENRYEVGNFFSEFLEALNPSVVHTHHYFQLGLEYLRQIKKIRPETTTFLTLHEYFAICPNSGLMKTPSGKECTSCYSLKQCECNSAATAEGLWMRKHRFERYFDYVDRFICPSAFLRDRYKEWGIAEDRLVVIENGRTSQDETEVKSDPRDAAPSRFGFFGQIGQHKGLEVVLQGLNDLAPKDRQKITLDVNGANLEWQDYAFRREISELARPLIDEGVVRWLGSYTRSELAKRMAAVDWVIVPSTWYENSPLVIQEAFSNGKPVVASDIGALPEKVQPGKGGMLVEAGNPQAWAQSLLGLSAQREEWTKLLQSLPTPALVSETADACVQLMAKVRAAS